MRESKLRKELALEILASDAKLSPAKRLQLAAGYWDAARRLFMAGMASQGFSKTRAQALWRDSSPYLRDGA